MSGNAIAVVGPAGGAQAALEQTLDMLLADVSLRQVIYLGDDDAVGEVLARRREAGLSRRSFLERAVELACDGGAKEIDALLAEHHATRRLSCVRRLPGAPALAVELLEKWIVLLVHDKAKLEEDDIANAHAIVYGRGSKPRFKRFGPRCFFTPGPLSLGHVGRLELADDGSLRMQMQDLTGKVVQTELLQAAGSRFSVIP